MIAPSYPHTPISQTTISVTTDDQILVNFHPGVGRNIEAAHYAMTAECTCAAALASFRVGYSLIAHPVSALVIGALVADCDHI